MKTHDEMVAEWMRDPEFKTQYDDLEDEYALLAECLKASKRSKLTQDEVAHRIGTKSSAVARIESGGGKNRHSPSHFSLRKYADAVGCNLIIKLTPKPKQANR